MRWSNVAEDNKAKGIVWIDLIWNTHRNVRRWKMIHTRSRQWKKNLAHKTDAKELVLRCRHATGNTHTLHVPRIPFRNHRCRTIRPSSVRPSIHPTPIGGNRAYIARQRWFLYKHKNRRLPIERTMADDDAEDGEKCRQTMQKRRQPRTRQTKRSRREEEDEVAHGTHRIGV